MAMKLSAITRNQGTDPSKRDKFKAPVTIEWMDEEGVSHKDSIKATYIRPTEDEKADWKLKDNKETMEFFLVDVDGMKDDENNPVEFSKEVKAALLSFGPAVFYLSATFWQCARMGRVKN